MCWALDDSKELLLIQLSVIMTTWLCLRVTLLERSMLEYIGANYRGRGFDLNTSAQKEKNKRKRKEKKKRGRKGGKRKEKKEGGREGKKDGRRKNE